MATPTTSIRKFSARLRAACAHRGVHLRDGAAEEFLADHVRSIATTLGITQRQAMLRYVTDHTIQAPADVIAERAERLQTTIDTASPLLISIPDAARIVAALGQAACWAAVNTERDPWHAKRMAETAGTMVTRWALAIGQAHGSDPVALIGADTAVGTRHVLATMAEKLSTGTWNAPSSNGDDQQQANLRLRDAITQDLALLP